jgi:hypothetical protein
VRSFSPKWALAGAAFQIEEKFQQILEEGVSRLKKLGLNPVAKLVQGQPAKKLGSMPERSTPISSSWATVGRAPSIVGGLVQRVDT